MPTAIQNREDVIRCLSRNKSALRDLGVNRIGLFGSFQEDAQEEDSDVDLLIEFSEGEKSFDRFMELSFFLEKEFGRRVELVTHSSLSEHIGPAILKQVEYVEIRD